MLPRAPHAGTGIIALTADGGRLHTIRGTSIVNRPAAKELFVCIRNGFRSLFFLWSLAAIGILAATPRAWPQDPQKPPPTSPT